MNRKVKLMLGLPFVLGIAAALPLVFSGPANAQKRSSEVYRTPPVKKDRLVKREYLRGKPQFNFFAQGTSSLRSTGDQRLMRMFERAPEAAARTTVWIAKADICDLPGDETMMHIEGPLTCGSAGCQMVVMGEVGGRQKIIARMVGETVSVPQRERLVMNEGTKSETTYRFDRGQYKRVRGRIK